MTNSVDPDQTAPIGTVCSRSKMFALSVMLGKYLQQTTSADDIFRCIFFLGALRVNILIRNNIKSDALTNVIWPRGYKTFLYPPQTLFVVGYTVFTLSVRPSVRPSVTFCFLNNLKSNCWIFIKLCKNIHICKTNT